MAARRRPQDGGEGPGVVDPVAPGPTERPADGAAVGLGDETRVHRPGWEAALGHAQHEDQLVAGADELMEGADEHAVPEGADSLYRAVELLPHDAQHPGPVGDRLDVVEAGEVLDDRY